jgi:hypothetical protein
MPQSELRDSRAQRARAKPALWQGTWKGIPSRYLDPTAPHSGFLSTRCAERKGGWIPRGDLRICLVSSSTSRWRTELLCRDTAARWFAAVHGRCPAGAIPPVCVFGEVTCTRWVGVVPFVLGSDIMFLTAFVLFSRSHVKDQLPVLPRWGWAGKPTWQLGCAPVRASFVRAEETVAQFRPTAVWGGGPLPCDAPGNGRRGHSLRRSGSGVVWEAWGRGLARRLGRC